jgi:hypothetical protein
MTDISNFQGRFRANVNQPRVSKISQRPRRVCTQCQKAKLKCDRQQPCSSCIKKGAGDLCSYEKSSVLTAVSSSKNGSEDRLSRLESMVKELIRSEAPGKLAGDNFAVANDSHEANEEDASSQERDVESRTYVGSTHWSAILDDIHELKVAARTTAAVEKSDEFMPLQRTSIHQSGDVIFGSARDCSLQQINSLHLPTRAELDRLLAKYFSGKTYILPFIHTSQFQRQYRDFWKGSEKCNPLWLSILFSICYITSRLGDTTDSTHGSSTIPGKSLVNFHVAAGKCLVLGQYQRPQKFAPEALVMYAHCKNLAYLDPSREAGVILSIAIRMAYEMGYHRDPDHLENFTVFEGEMRRRFWASTKAMDLMVSFMLGLPSNIQLESCDTKPPSNILDSDFDEDSEVLPPSRPENEGTKMLWFVVKGRVMIGFDKVCRHALSLKEQSEADVFQLDQEVREMQTTIPEVLRWRPLSESLADDPYLIITRIYLDFIYLKSLCVLHRKYVTRGIVFSMEVCIEAGTKMVAEFLEMYTERSPGGQLHEVRWMLHNYTMNDFLLGVMVLCFVIHTKLNARTQAMAAVNIDNGLINLLERSYVVCLEKGAQGRDAQRVAGAIRATLDAAKMVPTQAEPNVAAPPEDQSNASNGNLGLIQGPVIDWMSLDLPAWTGYGYTQSDEQAFGTMDAFDFSNEDFENVDWFAGNT